MPGSLTAAIYARVSTVDQNYEMQLAEACEYARRMGWRVAEYREKVSAAGKRPELDRLMEDARLKRIDVVVVWKLDRFGRSVHDLTENILKLDRAGVYMLSLKPAPLRLLLRMTGANVDREKGLEELRETAAHGHYLEPFAKLLLAVAALRDNNPVRARELLGELHRRFPDNELYTREMDRIDKGAHL
jgi:hypothetical protein